MAKHKSINSTILSTLLLGMVGIGVVLFAKPPIDIQSTVKPIKIHQEHLAMLKSYIPFLYTAVRRQKLQAIPLRMADQIVTNDENTLNASWVVMDKVIVIPKIIG